MVEYSVIDFQHNSLCPILVNKHNVWYTMSFYSEFCICIAFLSLFCVLEQFRLSNLYLYFFLYHENPSFFFLHEVLYKYLFSFFLLCQIWTEVVIIQSFCVLNTLNDKRHQHSIVIKYIYMIDA